MHNFKDAAEGVNERNTERMSIRVKPSVKAAIQQAATASGVSDSAFIMSAAYEAAQEVIRSQERTVLSPADHATFFDALDNPPPPTDRLRKAIKRYKARVTSR